MMKRWISLLLTVALALGICAPALAAENDMSNFTAIRSYTDNFPDVKATDWFYSSVKTCYEYGLMEGSNGQFNPGGNLTVAQALVMADRVHSIYTTGSDSLTNGKPWYQPYVDYALANGIILEGGRAPNILPDKVVVRLEYRAATRGRMNMLNDIMHKCAKGACIALDCEYTYYKGFDGFDDMVCVPALQKEVSGLLEALGHAVEPPQPPCGSSDVGNTSYRCPTIQPLFSICQPPYALHTIEFREETIKPDAHKAIADGAQLIAELVYKTMTDDAFRSQVNESYQTALKAKLDG